MKKKMINPIYKSEKVFLQNKFMQELNYFFKDIKSRLDLNTIEFENPVGNINFDMIENLPVRFDFLIKNTCLVIL